MFISRWWCSNFDLAVRLYVHFLPASAENEPKERRLRGEGLDREKANMPHFLALRHPLPLRNPSSVGRADEKCLLIDRGENPLAILSRSRDLTPA